MLTGIQNNPAVFASIYESKFFLLGYDGKDPVFNFDILKGTPFWGKGCHTGTPCRTDKVQAPNGLRL
jgi:hypothetical protein